MVAPLVIAGGIAAAGIAKGIYDNYKQGKQQDKDRKQMKKQIKVADKYAGDAVDVHKEEGNWNEGRRARNQRVYAADELKDISKDVKSQHGDIDKLRDDVKNTEAPEIKKSLQVVAQRDDVGPTQTAQGEAAAIQGVDPVALTKFDPAPTISDKVGSINAPTIAPVADAQAADLNGPAVDARQEALANTLSQQAQGQGPSLAKSMLAEQKDAAMQQQMSMLASQRGRGSAGLALAGAQNSMAQQNQALNREASMQAMREQQGAQSQLGSLLTQTRGQDIGLATTEAQLGTNVNLANMGKDTDLATEQARLGLDASKTNLSAEMQGLTADQRAQLETSIRQGEINSAEALANQGVDLNTQQFNAGNQQQMNLANMNAANQGYMLDSQNAIAGSLADQDAKLKGDMFTVSERNNINKMQAEMDFDNQWRNNNLQAGLINQQTGLYGVQAGLQGAITNQYGQNEATEFNRNAALAGALQNRADVNLGMAGNQQQLAMHQQQIGAQNNAAYMNLVGTGLMAAGQAWGGG